MLKKIRCGNVWHHLNTQTFLRWLNERHAFLSVSQSGSSTYTGTVDQVSGLYK